MAYHSTATKAMLALPPACLEGVFALRKFAAPDVTDRGIPLILTCCCVSFHYQTSRAATGNDPSAAAGVRRNGQKVGNDFPGLCYFFHFRPFRRLKVIKLFREKKLHYVDTCELTKYDKNATLIFILPIHSISPKAKNNLRE